VFAYGGGGPDVEGFYGVRNAFDGGHNIINGLNYSSWHAGAFDFVIVRFSQPVTVTGILVSGSSGWPSPEYFTVQIRSSGSRDLFITPALRMEGQPAVYAPPLPIDSVREVMLLFQARSGLGIGIEEIEILGPPPSGVNLSQVTPSRDSDLVRATSSQNSTQEA